MKKKLFWTVGIFAIMAFMSFNVISSSKKDNSSILTLSLTEISVGADAGTCCPQMGSICVIGDYVGSDRYFKEEGPCCVG